MAASRFVSVVGIIVLAVAMLAVVLYAINDFNSPLPFSCGDYGSSTVAPAECHRTNVVLYVVALGLLGSGVGFLWRRLGK